MKEEFKKIGPLFLMPNVGRMNALSFFPMIASAEEKIMELLAVEL